MLTTVEINNLSKKCRAWGYSAFARYCYKQGIRLETTIAIVRLNNKKSLAHS